MKKLSLVILSILLCNLTGFTQNLTDDQNDLMEDYNATLEDPNSSMAAKTAAYVGMSEILAEYDLESVTPLCKKAIEMADKGLSANPTEEEIYTLSKAKALAINNIGYVTQMHGDVEQALEYYEQSLILRKQIGDSSGMAEGMNNVAQAYEYLGDVMKSFEYLEKSMEISESIGDMKQVALVSNNLSVFYQKNHEAPKALEQAQRALALYRSPEVNFAHGEVQALLNIAASYLTAEQNQEAIPFLNEAHDIAKNRGYDSHLGWVYSFLGTANRQLGNLDKSFEAYSMSLVYRKSVGDHDGQTHVHTHLGRLFLMRIDSLELIGSARTQELYKAKAHLDTAIALANDANNPYRRMNAAEYLAVVHEKLGNMEESLKYFKLYTTTKDSLHSDEIQEMIVYDKARLEYESQKILDDAIAQKKVEVAKEREQKQAVISYSIAGGLGLSALFLLFVISRLRKSREQNKLLAQQKAEIEHAHKEITDSIHYAKRIQAAVLPPDSVFKALLPNAFVLYKPKDIVAGDFYWMEEKDGEVLFAAADCTGHGVPGAMVSVVCNNGLMRSVREMGLTDPGKILDNARDIVIQEFEKSEDDVKDGMDIALCSLKGKTLKYAGANNPLWLIRNGELIEYKANKQPIGKQDDPLPYTTHTVALETGDSIYIFSDGYPDQFGGERGKKYKSVKFKETLKRLALEPISDQKQLLERDFEAWKADNEQVDDVCVIGVRI